MAYRIIVSIVNTLSLHWEFANRNRNEPYLCGNLPEDECRVRQGHGAQSLALIRHLALNLLKNEKTTKVGIKIKRSKAGWDHRYLAKVLAVGQTSGEVA